MKNETVIEFLNRLSKTNSSSDEDSLNMEALLHKMGFPNARVVVGTVYMEGKGTIFNPPNSIHSCAKMLLDFIEFAKLRKK